MAEVLEFRREPFLLKEDDPNWEWEDQHVIVEMDVTTLDVVLGRKASDRLAYKIAEELAEAYECEIRWNRRVERGLGQGHYVGKPKHPRGSTVIKRIEPDYASKEAWRRFKLCRNEINRVMTERPDLSSASEVADEVACQHGWMNPGENLAQQWVYEVADEVFGVEEE